MVEIKRTDLPDKTGKQLSQMNFETQVKQTEEREISYKILETAYQINKLIDKGFLLLEKNDNQPWIQTYSELKEDGESDEKIIQDIKDNHQEYGK